jgi:hypothetical protein
MPEPTSICLGLLLCLGYPAVGQQPTDTAPVASPSQPPAAPPVASRASSSSKGNKKPLPVYLITGTVFNEKALSFPDVKVRIRHTSEKKFRWETYTNSRGEFAVRVPEGNEYEVRVQARNFKEQSQTVKVDAGALQPQLSFRLEPATPGKTGDKK